MKPSRRISNCTLRSSTTEPPWCNLNPKLMNSHSLLSAPNPHPYPIDFLSLLGRLLIAINRQQIEQWESTLIFSNAINREKIEGLSLIITISFSKASHWLKRLTKDWNVAVSSWLSSSRMQLSDRRLSRRSLVVTIIFSSETNRQFYLVDRNVI